MILRYPLCLIAVFLILTGCTRTKKAAAIKQLKELLDQKEYFRLETQFKLHNGDLNDEDRLYFKSFIDNAFNRNADCIKDVDSLLKINTFKLPDSVKLDLSRLQSDSYFKTYQYAEAAKSDSSLIKNYSHSLSKENMDDIKNDLIIRNALKKIPLQQTIIKKNTSIPWKKDKIGLIEIPVTAQAQTVDAIFDTRANISSITQTYARKLGLRILNATYDEGSGITGIKFKTGIGIADSLRIGNIIIRNAVFQVMPDPILYLAPIKLQLNIIIGFPIIEQLQEVDIFKDGRMVIPIIPAKSDLHNFALDGLDPVIALKSGNDTLSFNFDSGASSSDLYAAYFEKYKAHIIKTGFKKNVEYGGAGGSQKKQVYILPALHLTLGNKTVTIDSVTIMTKKIFPKERFYGNLGQDLMTQFNEMVFNFKYMYVKGVD